MKKLRKKRDYYVAKLLIIYSCKKFKTELIIHILVIFNMLYEFSSIELNIYHIPLCFFCKYLLHDETVIYYTHLFL